MEEDPLFLQLSHKAIEHFNSEHNTNYKFVEIVTVNTSAAAGMWCYITFLAKDSNASMTFQALVWWGIDEKIEVSFCRLKKQGVDADIASHLKPNSYSDHMLAANNGYTACNNTTTRDLRPQPWEEGAGNQKMYNQLLPINYLY
uniref:Cystatin domain-containing protein n=1 Tax=Solanum lycopersicum TaxID=4081 RepID=A0A3Q7EZZ9_SOLLC